jgi:prepilin-type N-terminal cleavage/methylation domain-containing protein
MNLRRRAVRRGFSLVEVVIALGIVAICLLTLMGLLASGFTRDQSSVEKSIAVNIAGAAVADLRATPSSSQSYTPGQTLYSPRFRFSLPAGTGPQTVYVADDGTPLTGVNAALTATGSGTYRVSILGPARPTGTAQRLASPIYVMVTWPGQADPNPATWPKNYLGSFQTVTYLDQN